MSQGIVYEPGFLRPVLSDSNVSSLMENEDGFTTFLPTAAGLSKIRIQEVVAICVTKRVEVTDPYSVDIHLSTGTIFTVHFQDPHALINWTEWLDAEVKLEIQRSIK